MKIKITGKKFLHISEDNLLTKGQTENIPIEIPRYYNDIDLKNSIFIMKSVNSDGIYIECPLSVTEYGVQKIYLAWDTSPIITACEGQIGFQLLSQSADKTVLYQSFVGYAIVNNGILASDGKNFSKDVLEEYLKKFRKIYTDVKSVGDLIPTNVVTKGDFDSQLKTKADMAMVDLLPKREEVLLKNDAKEIFDLKQNKSESAISAIKIDGVDSAGLSSYYGKDKNGNIGFHRLVVEGTGGSSVDMGLYYDKQQVDNLLSTKSDTQNVYSKTQTDTLLLSKAEKSEVYTKVQMDALNLQKAEVKDVYNKTFVDQKLDQKADLVRGRVPTEQLPPLGLGEQQQTYQGSYCFPSGSTNSIIGNKNYIVGEGCVCAGEKCFARGDYSVAVSGDSYGYLSYDRETQYITIDETYDGKDISIINIGDPIILINGTGNSVVATVLEKHTNHIKVDKAPPENCKIVVAPTNGKNNTLASGTNALACGDASIAIGRDTMATSDYTIALGDMSIAKGINSTCIGNFCETKGVSALSLGYASIATNGISIGRLCEAKEEDSISLGTSCYAGEVGATAIGGNNQALGKFSSSFGKNNTAKYGQTVVGICAVPSNADTKVFSATSEAFIVGSSADEVTPANAFRVDFNGHVYANAFNNTGADYAEYFEWEDKNPRGEDRVGLFVTPSGSNVRVANEGEYIVGAISGNAGVIGNNPMEWQKKYMRDAFGRFIYKGNEKTKAVTLKINPKWNSNQPYTRRCERKEWACVGMLGKIKVWDDGTCKVGEFCTVGTQGIAISAKKNSNQKWYVTKRVTKNIIEIILK